ncbi:MAG TPA: cysteine desulfurase [Chloroflexota bacterium]|nr:cysteine desulfurase [Chloroflexota bacterium]
MFDARQVRRDFPILERRVHGDRPLVYLDNAATSQKPRAVIQTLVDYYETTNANIHRGIHELAEEATARYEEARGKVARFIGAREPREIVFVRNTTEAINLVARTWGQAHLRPGDEIVVTEAEHHSNLIPWQLIARQTGAVIRAIPITDEGTLDLEAARRMIGPRTRLVALAHMSNVLGTIHPVAEIGRLAHAAGARLLVDGAQSVPHLPVNVAALDCDFLAFSGHKMCGPTGVGVLYAKSELLESLEPFLGGGGMIREVWIDRATWADIPERFEAGTPNIADVIALGTAVDYLTNLGMENIRAHEEELTRYALDVLGEIADVRLFGPRDVRQRGGVVSFYVGDVHPHDVSTVVDRDGVAIRAGHHCCQPLMRRLGVPATARASFYLYNVPEEIDTLARALQRVKEIFGGVGVG